MLVRIRHVHHDTLTIVPHLAALCWSNLHKTVLVSLHERMILAPRGSKWSSLFFFGSSASANAASHSSIRIRSHHKANKNDGDEPEEIVKETQREQVTKLPPVNLLSILIVATVARPCHMQEIE